MCSFGWDKSNHKVPQCPEKLGYLIALTAFIAAALQIHLDAFTGLSKLLNMAGSESGGAEEWYAEDPMKARFHGL